MIKVFRQETSNKKYWELRIFNMENGDFHHYMQDKEIGFIFGDYPTTVTKIGYESITDCMKELKSRKLLGTEVDYKEQRESEKIGFINLGVLRIKRKGRVNTKDFEDIIQKLSSYGLGYCDAQNMIIASYENHIDEEFDPGYLAIIKEEVTI